MQKGISATNLIVALAVGLIIIVGLGYLVWTWLGRGGGTVSESYCRGRELAFCTLWSRCNYVTDCKPADSFADYAPSCADLGWTVSEPECKTILSSPS